MKCLHSKRQTLEFHFCLNLLILLIKQKQYSIGRNGRVKQKGMGENLHISLHHFSLQPNKVHNIQKKQTHKYQLCVILLMHLLRVNPCTLCSTSPKLQPQTIAMLLPNLVYTTIYYIYIYKNMDVSSNIY